MGKAYLLDTFACSKYIQNLLDESVADFVDTVVSTQCCMSVITRMELLVWVTGIVQLEEDIKEFITNSTVLAISEEVIQETVRIRRQYRNVKLPDAIIAATARVNDWILLSTNDSDFGKIAGLRYRSLNA